MEWTKPRTWVDGEIVTVTHFNSNIRDNLRETWHEVFYGEFTAAVFATSAGVDVVSSGPIAYAADPSDTAESTLTEIHPKSPPVLVEFFSESAGAGVELRLYDDATYVALLGYGHDTPVHLSYRFAPVAGTHTYKVVARGSGGVGAGTGGTAATSNFPGYLRITQRGPGAF